MNMCFFGDLTKVPVKDRGEYVFLSKEWKTRYTMEDVYYVHDLKSNILSMEKLLEKGCSVFMKRPDFALEGQKWMSSRTCGDGKELDVQAQLKKYLVREVPLC